MSKVAMSATANDHLARYHHPHFVSMEPGRWAGQFEVRYRQFDGTEAAPQLPLPCYDDAQVSHEDRDLLRHEYRALHTAWGIAQFKHQARTLLEKAAPVWKDYTRARKAMDAAFAAFWETSDIQWKAQVLKLTDAHSEALAAARKWDEVAEGLAECQREHCRTVGEERELSLQDIGPEFGIDTSGWSIHYIDEYTPTYYRTDTPLVAELVQQIEQQRTRLREVAELSGDRRSELTF